jgi:chromosome segregation ATPase
MPHRVAFSADELDHVTWIYNRYYDGNLIDVDSEDLEEMREAIKDLKSDLEDATDNHRAVDKMLDVARADLDAKSEEIARLRNLLDDLRANAAAE